jgi:hypothetical protein
MSGVVISVTWPHLYADEIVVIMGGGFKCCPLAVISGDYSLSDRATAKFYASEVWSDFLHCSSLKAIYCRSSKPVAISNRFGGTATSKAA